MLSTSSKSHTLTTSVSLFGSFNIGLQEKNVSSSGKINEFLIYRVKLSRYLGFSVFRFTEVFFRSFDADDKCSSIKGSARPFESLGFKSFAWIISTSNIRLGAFMLLAFFKSFSWSSRPKLKASCAHLKSSSFFAHPSSPILWRITESVSR